MGKIGLVFAGGGGKGAYQIGVWKALREYGIDKDISVVAGTSVGGLNAALFAQGDLEKAIEIWENISRHQILSVDYQGVMKWFKQIEKIIEDDYKSYAASFFTRTGMEEIIDQNIDWSKIDEKNMKCMICCLKIMDNDKGKEVIRKLKQIWELFLPSRITNRISDAARLIYANFDAKYLHNCDVKYFNLKEYDYEKRKKILLATSAIPMIYSDVKIDDAYYVDGGLKDNLPINAVINEGCDTIYAVCLDRTNDVPYIIQTETKIIDIIPILPNNYQGGFFDGVMDFDSENAKKRMSDGYHDAIQILKGNIKIHNMFENQRENDKQWDKLYQKLE